MKTLLFVDLGNVTCHFDHSKRLTTISKHLKCESSTLDTLFWKSGFDDDCDLGVYSLKDICDFIRLNTNSSIGNNNIAKLWVSAFSLNKDFVEMIPRIDGFHKKILFTDNSPLIECGINSVFPEISKLFDEQLFSYKLSGTKKTHVTFERALQLYECEPHEALIIDDNEAVLMAAKKAGLGTIKYERKQCIRSIEKSLMLFTK